ILADALISDCEQSPPLETWLRLLVTWGCKFGSLRPAQHARSIRCSQRARERPDALFPPDKEPVISRATSPKWCCLCAGQNLTPFCVHRSRSEHRLVVGIGRRIGREGLRTSGGDCNETRNPLETSRRGIFAIGDVRSGSIKRRRSRRRGRASGSN